MQACRCDPEANQRSIIALQKQDDMKLLTDKETASMPDNLTGTLTDDNVSRSWRAAVASKEYWELRLKQLEWRVKRKGGIQIPYLDLYRSKYRLAKSELPNRQYTPLIIEGIAFAIRGGPPGVTEAYIKLDHLKAKRRQQIDQALKEKGINSAATIVYIVDGDNVPKFKETVRKVERRYELQKALHAKGLILRDDSRMGKAYVDEDAQAKKSLAETVAIADNMHVLHTHAKRQYNRNLKGKCEAMWAQVRQMRAKMWTKHYNKFDDDVDDDKIADFFDEKWGQAKDVAAAQAVKSFEQAFAGYNALPTGEQTG
ncbi:hypothetical protein HDU89_007831 [Geranomyces variabilis]|nr:hypothetical protein HDU89_007831 [Geranomyces variabilis]